MHDESLLQGHLNYGAGWMLNGLHGLWYEVGFSFTSVSTQAEGVGYGALEMGASQVWAASQPVSSSFFGWAASWWSSLGWSTIAAIGGAIAGAVAGAIGGVFFFGIGFLPGAIVGGVLGFFGAGLYVGTNHGNTSWWQQLALGVGVGAAIGFAGGPGGRLGAGGQQRLPERRGRLAHRRRPHWPRLRRHAGRSLRRGDGHRTGHRAEHGHAFLAGRQLLQELRHQPGHGAHRQQRRPAGARRRLGRQARHRDRPGNRLRRVLHGLRRGRIAAHERGGQHRRRSALPRPGPWRQPGHQPPGAHARRRLERVSASCPATGGHLRHRSLLRPRHHDPGPPLGPRNKRDKPPKVGWRIGWKGIEQLQEKDWVLSRSEHNRDGALEPKQVEAVFERLGLVFAHTVSGKEIRTTKEHPFYESSKARWTPAGELPGGARLLSHDGQEPAFEGREDSGVYQTVYNLRMADWHTYFVGGEDWGFSVWAHNTYTEKVMRDAVNQLDDTGYRYYRDPFTNTVKRTRQRLAADHIYAADRIEQLPGFSQLSRDQQLELLTDMRNIQGLPQRLNSSKGARSALEWKHALGREIDPQYTRWLRRKELQLEVYFKARIKDMLK